MDIDLFIRMSHIVGTVLGVGGATFAEIFFMKSLRDGKIDETEGSFLKITYSVIRWGMILLVLSGFGFFLSLRLEGSAQYIYSIRTWVKMFIVLVIVVNALLLSKRMVPMWLGSAISLTSWYTALILGAWRGLQAGYVEILIWYIVAIAVVAVVLETIRKSLKVKT